MIAELFKQCDCPRPRWPKCDHPFHFRKQVHGKRWTISLDAWLGHDQIRSVGAAEGVAAEMLALMRAGTFCPQGTIRGTAPTESRAVGHRHRSFADVAAVYQQLVEADPERKTSYKNNLRWMVTLVTGWPLPGRRDTLGELPIGGVDNATLERFYKAQVAAGKSVSYRNKMIQFLRHFSRWTVREGYRATPWLAPDDPSVTVKRRKGAKRDRRLLPGEYERLLAVAEPRLRDLCVATLECGARLAELTTLRWRDVDLPRRLVTIRDSKDPDGVKCRRISISDTLGAVFESRRWGPDDALQLPDAYVFGNAVGEPVASIATAWQNAVLKAHGHTVARDPVTHGLTAEARAAYRRIDLKFHDLRHEAASQWIESGELTLPDIQFQLGHESMETTAIYLNVRPDGLADRMAAFHRARAEAAAQSGVKWRTAVAGRPQKGPKLVAKNGRKAKANRELR